jgi:hypothetical protein
MARVIVELFGRAWLFEAHTGKVVEDDGQDAAHQHDPSGTTSAHIERGPGASEYSTDVESRKKFGFGRVDPDYQGPGSYGC